ncbi:MAG: sulfite oxidase [Lunatimonas sp.]|uniref:sulfite oxidase n=1 Tax=Lunatimonas sp. TaxID=2060141 RepID=UPI00263BCBE2|nr:sulfite oxidase [Lunatimonas sp.]MCC5937919.1 sulfite oxidase [Lunatimonas sp.]
MNHKKNQDRRHFLKKTGLGSLVALIGAEIVYALPKDYTPLVLENDPQTLFGKHQDLIVRNNQPWNVESPAHLLDDRTTPADKMFIRNNGLVPEQIDLDNWTLTIRGESVNQDNTYSLEELKRKFTKHSYQLVLECGGNGRADYYPPTEGNQWEVGAVSCAEWSGLRLRDLLADVGIKSNAVYVGFHAADLHLSRDANKEVISRGIPIAKAMEEETLIAYQMNGTDIPLVHGHPLRLIASGYPASVSGKWLTALSVRDRVHDGEKMAPPSYSIPCDPVQPGEDVAKENMCIIEKMPVKSLLTYPKSGAIIKERTPLAIRGHAWTGENTVTKVEYSIDFGATWKPCQLEKGKNRYSWQHFQAKVDFPRKGYYEVWARATDNSGKTQPMLTPGWNPKGYLNNACHRIAVKVS